MTENNIQLFENNLDEPGKDQLKSISLWATITAIASFASTAISIIQLVNLVVGYSLYTGGLVLQSVIVILVGLLMNTVLLVASVQVRKGLAHLDQSLLTRGLGMLKTYFKIYGILVILVIAIALLVIIYFVTTYSGY